MILHFYYTDEFEASYTILVLDAKRQENSQLERLILWKTSIPRDSFTYTFAVAGVYMGGLDAVAIQTTSFTIHYAYEEFDGASYNIKFV